MAEVSTPDTETEEAMAEIANGNTPGIVQKGREAGLAKSGSQGRADGGGAIDLDKLMHSIDMTRVSCLGNASSTSS
jgi:hypothetical protein